MVVFDWSSKRNDSSKGFAQRANHSAHNGSMLFAVALRRYAWRCAWRKMIYDKGIVFALLAYEGAWAIVRMSLRDLRVRACVWVCVCVCMSVRVCACASACACAWECACVRATVRVRVHVCACGFHVHVCTCACTRVLALLFAQSWDCVQ